MSDFISTLGYLALAAIFMQQPIVGYFTGNTIGKLANELEDYDMYPLEVAATKTRADVKAVEALLRNELKQLTEDETVAQSFLPGMTSRSRRK